MRDKPPRTARRASARAHGKIVRDLDRLARLEPGGSPERPLEVDSPARIEVMANALPCPLCGVTLRLDQHAAETVGGIRLRVARLTCPACRTPRTLYFRLAPPLPH